MYDNDQLNDSTYHYSYTPRQGGDPWDRPQPSPDPSKPPKKKRGGAGKAVALVLCCALAGGGAGVGGAALYDQLTPQSQAVQPADPDTRSPKDEDSGTVINRNDTDPVPVKVNQADGLTPMSLAEINAAYADACVCVSVQAMVQQGYYQYQTSGAGSGFIISEDGYIVTNYHVIDGAIAIKVTLNNGESYDAKLVGGEELNDVAVLKLDGVSGLKSVVLGDSDDLVVGETVCTIGNALGTLSFSMTSGAVSATGRSVTMSDGTVMNMIQTDCTINSGNSGGPLFDSYGRVVGITSAKLSNNGQSSQATIEGIGFAIPINDVIGIITDYVQYGHVTGRPSMGITVATLEENDVQRFGWPAGVFVNSVEQGSCAEKAGLRQGDIILKLGDTEVTNVNELTAAKNRFKAGETTRLTVYRAGEELTLTITFDEQDSTPQTTPDQPQTSNPQTPNGNSGSSGGYDYDPYGRYDGDDFFEGFPWDYFFGR